jgi:hypothetical protein
MIQIQYIKMVILVTILLLNLYLLVCISYLFFFFFFFFAVLVFELRASHLPDKFSTTWATPLVLLLFLF